MFKCSSRLGVFCKKGAFETFAKFNGKHLCQRLFFNKVAGLRPATLFKKDSSTGAFLQTCEIFTSFCRTLQVSVFGCLKKLIHQKDRKKTLALFSKFYGKILVGFCLVTEKHFSLEVSF